MRKSHEERKAEIVEVTLRLADATGPDRVTAEAIAAETGVTQPAIFRHFPTKASLWLAVARHVSAALAIGLGLILLVKDGFPRRVVLELLNAAALAGIIVVVCLAASGLGVRAALRVDPATARRSSWTCCAGSPRSDGPASSP